MSLQQETRFRCDRCGIEINVPLNDQPAMERGKPPPDWLPLHIGSNTATPWHLCPECRAGFDAYMREKGNE